MEPLPSDQPMAAPPMPKTMAEIGSDMGESVPHPLLQLLEEVLDVDEVHLAV